VNGNTTVTTNALGQAVVHQPLHHQDRTYTLSVSATGTSKVASNSFTIVPAAPILSFVNQPASGTAAIR